MLRSGRYARWFALGRRLDSHAAKCLANLNWRASATLAKIAEAVIGPTPGIDTPAGGSLSRWAGDNGRLQDRDLPIQSLPLREQSPECLACQWRQVASSSISSAASSPHDGHLAAL